MTKEEWWSKYDSKELCKFHSDQFTKWWDPELFDWKDSWYLAQSCFKYFDIWWDSEKYNWKLDSAELVQYCSRYFKIWWDPEKFDWSHSLALLMYCNEYNDVWLYDERFNWKNYKPFFINYLSKLPDIKLKKLCFNFDKNSRSYAFEILRRRKNNEEKNVVA